MKIIQKPQASEYAPQAAGYVSLVPEGDLLAMLEKQGGQTMAMLRGLSETEGDFRYGPGKWSIKQMVGHMSDTERVFAYRLLCAARNDRSPLPSFEQDDYVQWGGFDNRKLVDLLEELAAVRQTTLCLLRGLDDSVWTRRGVANQFEVSVRALAYMIAGHELHHHGILQERYLPKLRKSIA
jgi:hypothetical protein